MKRYLTFAGFTALLVLATACNTNKQAGMEGTTFGEAFTPGKVMPYTELAAKVPAQDSLAATVRGTVAEVCQVKGCWMTLTDAEGQEMMVRFKDYGFFMPKDISGKEVIMHGQAFYRVTPVDELRHYAEDAGKSEAEIAAITEPKKELNFLADGVILVK
ncbi:MAG: DUF4920 domain-containing protein [Saprospiraceae bacterium]